MQNQRLRVAGLFLWLIGIVGILPLIIMAPATLSSGAAFGFADFLLLGHVGAIVFALIFILGVGLCVYLGDAARIVLTLPALLVALLPAVLNLSPLSVSQDISERLTRIENPWRPAGTNLRALMDTLNQQRLDGIVQDQWENMQWEYAIPRNGGLRPLTFSTWNGGIRALTVPYLRGDHLDREQRFTLGWSFWIVGTPGDASNCPPDQVRHFYLRGDRNGVVRTGGNGCKEEGTLYKRRRNLLPPPALVE